MRFIIPEGFSNKNPVVKMVKRCGNSLAAVFRHTGVSQYKLRLYFSDKMDEVQKRGIEATFADLLKKK